MLTISLPISMELSCSRISGFAGLVVLHAISWNPYMKMELLLAKNSKWTKLMFSPNEIVSRLYGADCILWSNSTARLGRVCWELIARGLQVELSRAYSPTGHSRVINSQLLSLK